MNEEQMNVNESINEKQSINLTVGEKVTATTVCAAAVVGFIAIIKFAYEKGKGLVEKRRKKKEETSDEEVTENVE